MGKWRSQGRKEGDGGRTTKTLENDDLWGNVGRRTKTWESNGLKADTWKYMQTIPKSNNTCLTVGRPSETWVQRAMYFWPKGKWSLAFGFYIWMCNVYFHKNRAIPFGYCLRSCDFYQKEHIALELHQKMNREFKLSLEKVVCIFSYNELQNIRIL